MGIALAALPFLIVMLVRNRPERRAWVALALALVVFLPIACDEVHFGTYAQALLVIPYAACVAWLLAPDEAAGAGRGPGPAASRSWSAPCSGPMAWPMRCRRPASRPPATLSDRPGGAGPHPPGRRRSQTVLTFTDYAPSLLYDTPLRVLSIPNHRPQPGFATTYRILSALDPEAARADLARHRIDWILLCPSTAERAPVRPCQRRPADALPAPGRRHAAGLAPPGAVPPDLAGRMSLFVVVPAGRGRPRPAEPPCPRPRS